MRDLAVWQHAPARAASPLAGCQLAHAPRLQPVPEGRGPAQPATRQAAACGPARPGLGPAAAAGALPVSAPRIRPPAGPRALRRCRRPQACSCWAETPNSDCPNAPKPGFTYGRVRLPDLRVQAVFRSGRPRSANDITIVTQCSVDRCPALSCGSCLISQVGLAAECRAGSWPSEHAQISGSEGLCGAGRRSPADRRRLFGWLASRGKAEQRRQHGSANVCSRVAAA